MRAGDRAALLHFDGRAFAAAESGFRAHLEGAYWVLHAVARGGSLYGVWTSAARCLWTVGDGGRVVRVRP